MKKKPSLRREFRWRSDYRGSRKVAAEVVGHELDRIRDRDGSVSPKAFVDEARPDDAPMHPLLTWDNEAAAESWRREEAREVIGGVSTITISKDGTERVESPRVWLHVRTEPEGPRYMRVGDVQSDPELERSALLAAIEQVRAITKRFEELQSLLGPLEAVEKKIRKTA